MVLLNQCVNCSAPIAQPATGRRRQFCSDRCRKARSRSRWEGVFGILVAPTGCQDGIDDEMSKVIAALDHLPTDPDEAVVQTVVEGWALVRALDKCAGRARPQLSWRCGKAADEIREILGRYFAAPGRAVSGHGHEVEERDGGITDLEAHL
jgi:hypothetical protein